ncbi:cuticle protein AM1199-like [Penaeus indicus]|uniref:cuticle protein AM1199-like n=1 Tax=Penaeus indicus TaxID=29960 RepID=UPI00300BFCAC
MKLILLSCCLASMSLAATLTTTTPMPRILKDSRLNPQQDGRYSLDVETEDGLRRVEASDGAKVQGAHRFVHPDGTVSEIKFVADEFGYRAVGDLLPTPPPMPAHALAQIEAARLQREEAARLEAANQVSRGVRR